MPEHIDAGELRDRLEVLDLERDAAGNWAWSPVRRTWGKVTQGVLKNLFSSVGIGARDAAIVVRRQTLTLHNALRWNGTHLFLTSILPFGRNHLELHAAACQPVMLTAKPQDRTGRDALNRPTAEPQPEISFPGILTELYHRNDADDVFRTVALRRVLVTPKVISLRTGDLVRQEDEPPYTVRQVLTLDPWKNEYIIERQEDV